MSSIYSSFRISNFVDVNILASPISSLLKYLKTNSWHCIFYPCILQHTLMKNTDTFLQTHRKLIIPLQLWHNKTIIQISLSQSLPFIVRKKKKKKTYPWVFRIWAADPNRMDVQIDKHEWLLSHNVPRVNIYKSIQRKMQRKHLRTHFQSFLIKKEAAVREWKPYASL